MSQHFNKLKVGDEVAFKGPYVKVVYEANSKKEIGLVAGGTGITPVLPIIDAVLDNTADNTKISLIFANNTEKVRGRRVRHGFGPRFPATDSHFANHPL